MRVYYPKSHNMAHTISPASKGSSFYILFAIIAAGVVPCGGPKKSPHTSSIVQIILSFVPLRSVRIFRLLKLYV